MQRRSTIVGLALLALVGPGGCGGGGSSSSGGGSNGMNGISWPLPDGGTSNQVPPAVVTGRVVFESQSGESCCVAVDPTLLSGSSAQGLAVLTDLPPGPATVTVAGFSTDFAPTVPGILATCTTVPATAAQPCDPVQVAAPAFESAPLSVTITAGVQTNLGTVPMVAMPFLLDYSPAQNTSAPAPVQFALTVVDAVTNIRSDSVALDVTFIVPTGTGQGAKTPSPFRSVTKRVRLVLTACADGSTAPCSQTGALQVAGFAAAGTAPELPEGSVEAHITAENLGDPPQQLDFRYPLNVLATATATATPAPTLAPAALNVGGDSVNGVAASAMIEGSTSGPDRSADARSGAASGAAAGAATPTATPAPH